MCRALHFQGTTCMSRHHVCLHHMLYSCTWLGTYTELVPTLISVLVPSKVQHASRAQLFTGPMA